MKNAVALLVAVFAGVATLTGQQPQSAEPESLERFRFKSGVELINVTATVTDASGRFVPELRQEDFIVYEDDEAQNITHFSAERVPVSLGIVLDTSGSMAGEKIEAARAALDRFLFDLLDERDEIFLYRFNNDALLLEEWTTDRRLLSRALGRISTTGGTAMYDAVVEAIPMAAAGRNPKKAVLVISDGNDTSSRAGVHEVRQLTRESEVLVYAIGLDSDRVETMRVPTRPARPRPPLPFPWPGGRGRRPFPSMTQLPQITGPGGGWGRTAGNDDRVNVVALRDMTDDSGGRTEIVRNARDLNPATASIADELSKQYYLGYASAGKKDGRWHSIRVEVRNTKYRVRARRGYVAS
ncbi:MAG: VWA domain-containing protein [Luteitalea sp.]|nr:VWA domain-containing protein [Luteitalea sp.]